MYIIGYKIMFTFKESVDMENAGATSVDVVVPQRRLLVALFLSGWSLSA